MRQILDFIPLVIFFTVYHYYNIFTATYALIITTVIVLAYLWYQFRKADKGGFKAFLIAEKMPIFTTLMVVVFGSLTIYFQKDSFLIWKVTIIYGLFALALVISQFIFKKNLIQSLLGKEISLPDQVWSKISVTWSLLFVAFGILNLYVGFSYPQETWVTFKSFVFPAILFVFTLCTGIYIYRFLPKENSDKNTSDKPENKN